MVAPNLLRVGTTEKVFVEAQDYTGDDIQMRISVQNYPQKTSELTFTSVILNAANNYQIVADIKVGFGQIVHVFVLLFNAYKHSNN